MQQKLLDQPLSLDQLELIVIDVPQKIRFVSGIGERHSRRTLIVKWTDADGRIGYGECSCRPDPYYSAEYLKAAVLLIQDFIAPQLRAKQTFGESLEVLQRIRGWNFTKAAVEAAAYQVAAPQAGHQLSDELRATPTDRVPVGISLGIYDDGQALREVVQQALAEGYRRLKFKIAPHVDTRVFEAINPLLFDSGVALGFDANGSFKAGQLDKLAYYVNTYQTIIEQPLPPDRYDLYRSAKALYPTLRVCADEEVKGLGALVKLHALGAIDQLNLKVGRVGGLAPSIEILNYCHEHDIDCWIGGMFETGIGRMHNLHVASFLPDAVAHDLSPSSRYFEEDVIAPTVAMQDGTVSIASLAGNAVLPELLKKFEVNRWTYRPAL